MLSLDEVHGVVAELAPACVGSFIQKIQQPTPDTILLSLRRPGRSLSLLLSTHAQHGRLHLVQTTIPSSPPTPSFCQYLRAHVSGAKIHRLAETPHDRIVWFELHKKDTALFLVLALTGRSANVFVLDSQTTVLRSLKPWRQIAGQPFGRSPFPCATASDQATLPSSVDVDDRGFPLSQRIEEMYLTSERRTFVERQRLQQFTRLRKQVKTLQRRIAGLTQDLKRVSAYEEYGRYGELLKSHVSTMRKGQTQMTVVDYFDERLPELTLQLDPEKTGPANLDDYFKKHGKFIGAQKNLVPRLEQAKTDLANLQKELQELESGKTTDVSEHPSETLLSPTLPQDTRRSRINAPTATLYRRFRSRDGHAILVGKTAKDNDAVTFKVSKANDLWLHARGTPGSHVIVELDKNQQIPPETLKDAATLALFYSDVRKSGKGDVIYTLRKHVKKPKGAKPGSVTVTREKTTWVTIEHTRLDRLKQSNG